MTNDPGCRVKVAGPSTPVPITGLNEAPMAGDHFAVLWRWKISACSRVRRTCQTCSDEQRQAATASALNAIPWRLGSEICYVIIKADVQVRLKPCCLLQKIGSGRCESDHRSLSSWCDQRIRRDPCEASNAFIIGFNVTLRTNVSKQKWWVEIRLHSIIYKVIEEMEDAIEGMLDPEFEEKVIRGKQLFSRTFKVSEVGTIGGFMILNQ